LALAALVLPVGLWAQDAGAAPGCADPLSALPRLDKVSLDLDALKGFYGVPDGQAPGPCVWTDDMAAVLQATLGKLGEDGLDPEQFHLSDLAVHANPADAAAAQERDLLATDAALAYARAMVTGRVDVATLSDQISFPPLAYDPAGPLRDVLGRGELAAWLVKLVPTDPQYAGLKAALAHYRTLAAWQIVPSPGGKAIDPGSENPVIPALKQRLVVEGELAAADKGDTLDGAVLDALKHFQHRHGLTPDGRLGKGSFAALNVPLAERIGQIVANLERRREVARRLQPTRIEVNVAAATVTVLRDGEAISGMRAVVGDAEHQTPMLISNIRDVEINPPWIVPASIIKKEIRPKLKRDPEYLTKNEMAWSDSGQLIQAPGNKNSLGHLKFEFSNPFDVYLHDTPMHSLFALDGRALSHGCVRLEHPVALAQSLLATESPDPIQQAIDSGTTSRMRLATSVQVAVLYWSVMVEPDGTVDFRDDLYRRDARLVAALAKPRRLPGTGAPAPVVPPPTPAPVLGPGGGAEHCVGTCRNT
jgi:murein L,D-transpeptidase YcbB/YkuD